MTLILATSVFAQPVQVTRETAVRAESDGSHFQTCVTGVFESNDLDDRDAKIEELVRVFEKNVGS